VVTVASGPDRFILPDEGISRLVYAYPALTLTDTPLPTKMGFLAEGAESEWTAGGAAFGGLGSVGVGGACAKARDGQNNRQIILQTIMWCSSIGSFGWVTCGERSWATGCQGIQTNTNSYGAAG
jgi:hypothetical protein